MIKNNLKIAFRVLINKKGFSLINILGLAIGLASCFFILLYVQDELSFEKFHDNSEYIYLVGLDGKIGSEEFRGTSTPQPLAFTLVNDYQEVKQATRLSKRDQVIMKSGEKIFNESKVYYVDSTFLDVFTYPLIRGNKETALNKPNSIILSKEMTKKYFGNEEAMGKVIRINNEKDYIVTGICKNPPVQSHLEFDFLIPISDVLRKANINWGSNNLQTYIVLNENFSRNSLDPIFYDLLDKHFGPILKAIMNVSYKDFLEAGNRYSFFLEPLLETHLNSTMTGGVERASDIIYVWVLSMIAFFILLVACVNFVNLTTARAALRAKEVGVRKTIGAVRKQLIAQFLTESFLISSLSMVIAIASVELLLPYFNNIVDKNLIIEYFSNPIIIPAIFGLIIFAGLIAGTYSAFFQSSFSIQSVLKGEHRTAMKSGMLRNVLVLMQFSVSIFLIVCTLVVFNQIKYFQNREIGFDKEKVMVINRAHVLPGKAKSYKEELLKFSGIEAVSLTRGVPMDGFSGNGIIKEGSASKEAHILQRFVGDYDLLKTFGIELIEGRFFDKNLASDSNALVFNEAAIPSMGITDPFNERLIEPSDLENASYRSIIGIVKDFNYMPFSLQILPLAIELSSSLSSPRYVAIRINKSETKNILKFAEQLWNDNTIDEPFEYYFMNDVFDKSFSNERKRGKIYTIFAGLAIFIACLGLFSLAAFAAEQRSKEIGVRKAMGANSGGLIWLIAREFIKWVLLANIIAWPLAYWLMNNWLTNFAYRIDLEIWFFIIAGLVTFVIALLTVSYQSYKAAAANPVVSLKYE